jgi:hypothetical protein
MEKSVSKLVYGVFKFNITLGVFLSLLLSILISTNAGVPFFIGTLVSSINFTSSAFITSKIFSDNKPNFIIYVGYILRIALVIVVAIPFVKIPLSLMMYVSALIFHYISLGIYWFSKGKGSD